MNLHLLVIEDEPVIIDNWKEKLDFYNIENDKIYTIIPTYATELGEAKKLLSNSFFNAAVIDIRLSNLNKLEGQPNKDGYELFDLIKNSSLTVAAICTGEPALAEEIEDEDKLAKIFEKGDGVVEQVLTWLDDNNSMISAIQNMQEALKKEMAKAFSKSIWPRWDYWFNESTKLNSSIEPALRRHMATHLHATFLSEVTAVHPEEYYFIPPLIDKLDTGDITLVDGKHYILVTPRCEIAQKKNSTFQFVELSSIASKLSTLNDKIINNKKIIEQQEGTEGLSKTAEEIDDLRKLIAKDDSKINNLFRHGGNKASLHFLPEIKRANNDNYGPFHANFDRIIFILKSDTEKLTNFKDGKYASLSNEFVPSLVERLGAYFSRIGTPNYSHPE